MKKYVARPHAVDRALLRFNISTEIAENWFNQLMQNARYIGDTDNGTRKIYDHKGKRIIVQGDEIVTIFTVADLPFGEKIASLVERELKRAKKSFEKRSKELSLQIAEAGVEQATLSLNLLKAKSPKVKRSIQTKLGDVAELVAQLNVELERESDTYKAIQMQSKGYLIVGGEAKWYSYIVSKL